MKKKILMHIASIVVWLLIWQLFAIYIDNEIFLPAPIRVFKVLIFELIPSEEFGISILSTMFHIGLGFLIGTVLGIVLAILSSASNMIKVLLWFPINVIKAVPVASFVILALLWVDAESLSILISAMIVMPIMYINTMAGIENTNGKLIEMAEVFRVRVSKRITRIYLPLVIPHILSASSLAVGMAWKGGIAAQIIGLAKNSIGNELYKAKLYLMVPELFAWTIVIVLFSVICESVIKKIIKKIQ